MQKYFFFRSRHDLGVLVQLKGLYTKFVGHAVVLNSVTVLKDFITQTEHADGFFSRGLLGNMIFTSTVTSTSFGTLHWSFIAGGSWTNDVLDVVSGHDWDTMWQSSFANFTRLLREGKLDGWLLMIGMEWTRELEMWWMGVGRWRM